MAIDGTSFCLGNAAQPYTVAAQVEEVVARTRASFEAQDVDFEGSCACAPAVYGAKARNAAQLTKLLYIAKSIM